MTNLNEKIRLPAGLDYLRPLFVRFAAPSAEEVGAKVAQASPEELRQITDLSIRLLGDQAGGAISLLAHAEALEANGDVDSAARVRSFVEGIMPVPG